MFILLNVSLFNRVNPVKSICIFIIVKAPNEIEGIKMNIINFATPKGGESFLQRYFLLQGLQKRYKELAQKGVNHSTKVFSFIQPFQGCE